MQIAPHAPVPQLSAAARPPLAPATPPSPPATVDSAATSAPVATGGAEGASRPSGWTPTLVKAVPSARREGMVPGLVDAIRGAVERGDGQQLSAAQVGTLAPFLATAYGLPAETVRDDLRDVRIYVGGPGASKPSWAVTLGHDVYVRSKVEVDRLLSWEGRRWLAHELGHTMQWRRLPYGPDDAQRTRYMLLRYATGVVADRQGGALLRGAVAWLRGVAGGKAPDPADLVHDHHRMEQEAERTARAFVAAHP